MTTASCPLATALWAAHFGGVWLPSCYTSWGSLISVAQGLELFGSGSDPPLTRRKSDKILLGRGGDRSSCFFDCQVKGTESLSQSQPPQQPTGSCTSKLNLGNKNRLCNLSSGNCIERCARILASPLYICLCVSDPLFIDFDEDGANEPHERVFIREDPHFGCASF